jgi:hypothetical protein
MKKYVFSGGRHDRNRWSVSPEYAFNDNYKSLLPQYVDREAIAGIRNREAIAGKSMGVVI